MYILKWLMIKIRALQENENVLTANCHVGNCQNSLQFSKSQRLALVKNWPIDRRLVNQPTEEEQNKKINNAGMQYFCVEFLPFALPILNNLEGNIRARCKIFQKLFLVTSVLRHDNYVRRTNYNIFDVSLSQRVRFSRLIHLLRTRTCEHKFTLKI